MKKAFYIEHYPQNNTAMCCQNQEELGRFLDYLASTGRTWVSGDSYLTWRPNFDNTAVYVLFNEGQWGTLLNEKYSILHFDDFSWCETEAKPEFDIYKYQGLQVMFCETQKEADIFCNYLHDIGKRWNSRTPYCQKTNFGHYDKTCYNFNYNSYGALEYYEKNGYTILRFSDFSWDNMFENMPQSTDLDEFLKCFTGGVQNETLD